MAEFRDNEEYESSDEDVFECGRCKVKFTSMDLFMIHKKSKFCYRFKNTSNVKQEVKSCPGGRNTPESALITGVEKIGQDPVLGNDVPVQSSDVVSLPDRESGVVPARSDDPGDLKAISSDVIKNILEDKPEEQPTDKDTFVQSLALQPPSPVPAAADNQQRAKSPVVDQDGSPNNSGLVDIIRQASIASGIEMAEQMMQEQQRSQAEDKQPDAPVECSFCSEKIASIAELCSHFGEIHNIANEKATLLAKEKRQEITKAKLTMRRARMVVRDAPKHFCKICSMSFKTASKLTKHRKTKKHLDKKDQQQDLRSRKRREHQLVGGSDKDEEQSEDQGPLKCASCDYEASEMSDLRDHLTSHKKLKGRYQCSDCDLTFTTRADLSDHSVAEHGKELRRPYKNRKVSCSDCGQQVQQRSLAKHKQIHSQPDAELVCPLCKHESAKSSDYELHVENHKVWVSVDKFLSQNHAASAPVVVNSSRMVVMGQLQQQQAANEEIVTAGSHQSSTIDLSSLGLEHIRTMQAAESLAQMCPETQSSIVENISVTRVNQPLDAANQLPGGQVSQANTSGTANRPAADDSDNTNRTPDAKNGKGAGNLKCKECDTTFARDEMPRHMLAKHMSVKKFQCRDFTCKQTYDDLKEFSLHVVTNHDILMFNCSCRRCLKKGKVDPHYKAALKKEKMRVYYQQMGFKCMKCWVKFPTQAGLDRHLSKESHNYPCPECDKIHVSKRQLRIHMITHQTERQYLCEKCGQDFKTPRDLQRHSISHSNIKPFQCMHCGKGFGFRNKLHRHILTVHSAVKPYNCPEPGCTKAFARKDKLTDHQRTHLTYEPFKCDFCQRGFFRKDNLKDHLVLHTGEFRFRCDICSKGFMRPKLLERHRKQDHSNDPQPPQQTEAAAATAIVEPGYQICTIDGQSFSLKEVNSQVQIQVKIA